jgi:hypothetical protein
MTMAEQKTKRVKIIDTEAATALVAAIIRQAHQDASNKSQNCSATERRQAGEFIKALQEDGRS